MIPFLEMIKERVLLADGAMGTELYRSGFFINQCYESLNLSAPDKVAEIHSAYIRAGADIIETNTFGANRHKLDAFGLGDRVAEINARGVEIARKAAEGRSIYIAGSIGPVGKSMPIRETASQYCEQAKALAAAGADLIILETFRDLFELEAAVSGIKKCTGLPVIAQTTVFIDEHHLDGIDEESIAQKNALLRTADRLNCMEADIVGLNCGTGPSGLLYAINLLLSNTDKPVSCMPNAGHPEQVGDRMLYMSTPEYLGEFSGRMIRADARIVGGCCGTNALHIKEMRNVITSIQPRLSASSVMVKTECSAELRVKQVPLEERSSLAQKMLSGKFVSSVEINPPKGIEPHKQIAAAKMLKEAGVDAINIADGPRASSRMSPLSMAIQFKRDVDIDVIIHYCCRDRNLIGMQGDLMGAASLGLNNVLCITGDRPKLGDYPDATAVFDFDAIGLVGMAEQLNKGMDLIGNPIGKPASFFIGVGANPGAQNFDEEMGRLEKKIEAGAQFIMTQPVFDVAYIERFMKRLDSMKKIPVMLGLLPLYSFKNAEFVHNEVPGMNIPEDLRKRMEACKTKEAGMEEGIKIARELLVQCKPGMSGVYTMPPFGLAHLAVEVLR